jgi:hypothetical protein
MLKAILFVLLISSVGLACDFSTATEWVCLPCGGPFSCTGTGTCLANAGDVAGCTLIDGATSWMCCDAAACDVTGTGMCDYFPPSSNTVASNTVANTVTNTGSNTGGICLP